MKKCNRKTEQIFLEDHYGSASQAILSVRSVLWGIVEHVARQRAVEDEVVDEENPYVSLEAEEKYYDDAAATNHNEYGDILPVQFGSNKQKKSQKKKNKKRKRKQWCSRVPDVDHLPVLPTDPTQVIEHNIAYVTKSLFLSSSVLRRNESADLAVDDAADIVWLRVVGIAHNDPADSTLKVVVKKLVTTEYYVIDYSLLHFVHLTTESAAGYSHSEHDVWTSFYINNLSYKSKGSSNEIQQTVHCKYWDQRYRIFSKYDKGIRLDAESWYSITYEIIGDYIVDKCLDLARNASFVALPSTISLDSMKLDVVLDCFSGCGGSAIPFARRGIHTIAVDIDPVKLSHLKHNARIYEAADDIDCIQADVWSTLFQLGNPHRKNRLYEKLVKMIPKYNVYKYYPHGPTLETNTLSTEQGTNTSEDQGIPPVPTETRLPNDSITATVSNPSSKSQHRASGKADLIILSPPWGGPDYIHTNKFDLTTMLTFVPGFVGDEKKVEEKKADDTSEKDDILNVKDGMTLVLAASAVAENIVYIVPRNTSTVQLTMLANILALPYQIEEIVINHKPKVTVAYYGYLFKKYT